MNLSLRKMFPLAVLLGFTFVLAACGGGASDSGQENERGIDTTVDDDDDRGVVYTGPTPLTDDIQSFKLNVWDNLAGNDRCGACHNETVGQTPQFVRADDVNLAYEAANTIVDKSAAVLSRMVTKVAEGHNCWENNATACASTIERFIEGWAADTGASANVVVLTAPESKQPGATKNFPADASDFESTVWALVRQDEVTCSSCHAEDGSQANQQPYFASPVLNTAYQAAKTKIDLSSAARSRLVVRLREEGHNCWEDPAGIQDACTYSANQMQSAIEDFLATIPEPEGIDEDLVFSDAVVLSGDGGDGIIASSGGRVESDLVALYEFKAGEGSVAFDTSGVNPSLNLNLNDGVEWVGSWGIRIIDGKAQGDTASSKKLYDLISATGEYSIEAWVIPANVSQEGPARIVTYSGGSEVRNFTLGQTLYDYNFLTRSSESDGNGMPALSTPSALESLQSTLQHVVVTFDPIEGRRIYVNGEIPQDVADDSVIASDDLGGSINDWDDTFALALGNEVDNQQLWQGTIRLLAIHNRVLTQEQVTENFDAGVGQKFFLLFGVSHLIDMPEAYIVFEVEVFDDYSYLFNSPFFISLDKSAVPTSNIQIEGLRIGINGREAPIGQLFANMKQTIRAETYNSDVGVPLSPNPTGTVIGLESGADSDEFFLTFDRIGDRTYDRPDDEVPPAAQPSDLDTQPEIGLRVFSEINATMSEVTGVLAGDVADTYSAVIQQLPSTESADGFVAAQQSGVMQLSLAYCTALVNDDSLRSSYFPGFDFGNASALNDDAGRDLVILPIMNELIANQSLATQPDASEMRAQLDNLIASIPDASVSTKVISVCSAALGSAVMLLQ